MTYKLVDNFNVELSCVLGQGSFATVYKAHVTKDPTIEAAVKMIPSVKLRKSPEELNLFMREIEVLRQIKGEHVAQLLDVKTTVNNLYIFMEYCNGGTLKSMLSKKKIFSEDDACSIIKQIATAFVNLSITNKNGHKVTVMHRDIKPDNILFHKGKVKVADFGFAKTVYELDQNIRKAHTICGTPLYEAPQVLAGTNYSAKCDIWSTGVLFYEILFGQLPWAKSSVARLTEAIKVRPMVFPKNVSSEVKDLINKMLMVREEDRISWNEVYNHPALNKEKEPVVMPKKMMLKPVEEQPEKNVEDTKDAKDVKDIRDVRDVKDVKEEKEVLRKPVILNKKDWIELDLTPKKAEVGFFKENITPVKKEMTPTTKRIFGDDFKKKKREFFPDPIKLDAADIRKDTKMQRIEVKIGADKSPIRDILRRLI